MSTTQLGPRRQALLESWTNYAAKTPLSEYHNFSDTNRHTRVTDRVESFLASPSRETFEAVWSPDVLRDAVMGGPDIVVQGVPRGIEELAERIAAMQEASGYDPAWEENIVARTALWELYGYLEPTNRPILDSVVLRGLDAIGYERPNHYRDRPGYEQFARDYERVVGHATADTDHEVPWHFEIAQFLAMLGAENRYTIHQELGTEIDYQKLVGWDAEGEAGRIVFSNLDPLLEKYIDARAGGAFGREDTGLWGDWWESWKWTHAEHVHATVMDEFELNSLDSDEVDSFLGRFKNAPEVELSSAVPTYLLGGRSGGILWSEFANHSTANTEETAAVLSKLFDEDEPLVDRLSRFGTFYGDLNTSGGPLLSLATMFLMFVYPTDYVMYKHGKFTAFFDAYSDYEVSTGFDTRQYWVLNEACRRIRRRLDAAFDAEPTIEEDATMLDVHTLIWVTVGVEEL